MFHCDDIAYYISCNYLRRDLVVLDAGANNGHDAIKMSHIWPYSIIYAIEPNPEIYPVLLQNVRGSKNIKTFNLALGDGVGRAKFYISRDKNSFASSLFTPSDLSAKEFNKVTEVPVTTLDLWAHENGVSRIDFLRLDMQGGEGAMLFASPEILKTVKVIQLEFYTFYQYKGIVLLDELEKYLKGLNFKVLYKEPEDNGNIIFVKK